MKKRRHFGIDLVMEPEFKSKICRWVDTPTVDIAYYGVSSFVKQRLDKPTEILPYKDKIVKFILSMYDENFGCFKQTDTSFPNIYSALCAIIAIATLMKMKLDVENKRKQDEKSFYPLNIEEVNNFLNEQNIDTERYNWNKIKESVFKFIMSSFKTQKDEEGEFGYFKENPWTFKPTSSVITLSGLRLLAILGYLGENINNYDDLSNKVNLCIKFLNRCFINKDNNLGMASTIEMMKEGNIWSCPHYFYTKAVKSFNYEDTLGHYFDSSGIGPKLFTKRETKEKVLNFVMSCWDKDNGGFKIGNIKNEPSTVIHTKYCLGLLNYLEMLIAIKEKFKGDDLIGKILNLLKECFVKVSDNDLTGFGFIPGDYPNLYTTRNAVEVIRYLEQLTDGKDKRVTSFKEEVFPVITNSILNKFFNKENGSFIGIPIFTINEGGT